MARILAIGSGGFFEPEDAAMQRYILAATDAARPRVCFLATGKGDNPQHYAWFDEAFGALPCETSHLRLFERTETDLEAFVCAQDIVLVWGGNTASLLAVWQAHGLHRVLRTAAASGVVLAGFCAGALAWFEAGITDSFGDIAPLRGGLGLLPGSLCPHYDGDPRRKPMYLDAVASGTMAPGYALDADAGLRFEDGVLTEAFTSRPGASAWRVDSAGASALPTRAV